MKKPSRKKKESISALSKKWREQVKAKRLELFPPDSRKKKAHPLACPGEL